MNNSRTLNPAIVFLFFVIWSLSSCASSKEPGDILLEFDTGDLHGMIYDTENRPCQGALIRIDDEDGMTVVSDVNGRFTLPTIPGGTYKIITTKKGFETNTFDFEYTNRKQVLYIRLISYETILSNAEKALDALEWQEVEDQLSRAAAIDAEDSRYLVLMGAYAYRRDNTEEALEYWLTLVSKGHRDPYLYLMIADAYQYGLSSETDAIPWLEKYLDAREDAEIRDRLIQISEDQASTE